MPCHTIFSKSHCQRSDWLNGMHLIRWTSIAICRLRCLIPWQIRSTCLRCYCLIALKTGAFTCPRKYKIWQAILFICYRSTRLYSGVLTYALPIMLLCALNYFSLSDTANNYFSLRGSSPVWDFSDSVWSVYNLFFYQQIYKLLECGTVFKVHCNLEHLWKVLAVSLLLGFLVIFSLCTLSLTVTTSRYSSLITLENDVCTYYDLRSPHILSW